MTPVPLFSALADPTRLRVVELLHESARPVHELAQAFAISRPAISRHLRVLKEAGLVREVKQGRENVYSLQRDKLKPAAAWLERHGRKLAAVRDTKRKVRAPGRSSAKPKPSGATAPVRAPAPQLSFFDL
ncbi:ArsR/SmtB family transcription factor [Devosia sp.]|uniref:ArsR/SmtB family transcription factor n=1 Tax=Devosia sp. TaxID=1871048 RepID=UPI0035AFDB99